MKHVALLRDLARRSPAVWLGGVALVVALRAVRLGVSYDVTVDEITYLRLAQNVLAGRPLELYGSAFHLHPPLYFVLEAVFLAVVHPPGDLIAAIYSVRVLNVVFAALTAAVLFPIARRAGGLAAGAIVLALFALDPFVIKLNSLNYIETSALFWVSAGYALMLAGEARVSPWRATAAGLAFGLGLISKDMTAFVSLLPLALCLVLKRGMPRQSAVIALLVALDVYALYVGIIVVLGQGPAWFMAKTEGVLRLAGMLQETGFNRGTGPSFLESVLARLDAFGATYLLIGLGAPAAAALARRGRDVDWVLALWAASAYALLAYAIAWGTNEEQFYYFLIVPALPAIGTAVAWLAPLRRELALAAAAIGLVFTGVSARQWVIVHTQPDNAHEALVSYLESHVAPGGRVAATGETAQFVLSGSYGTGPWGNWVEPDDLRAYHPDYLVVSPRQVLWDHGAEGQALLDWVERTAFPVFEFSARPGSAATLALYRLPGDW
jgi:hypothetical protein